MFDDCKGVYSMFFDVSQICMYIHVFTCIYMCKYIYIYIYIYMWRPVFCMLAQNEHVGLLREKRDMVEGCLSIGFCVRAGRKWCFPFFQWLSRKSRGDLVSTTGFSGQLREVKKNHPKMIISLGIPDHENIFLMVNACLRATTGNSGYG